MNRRSSLASWFGICAFAALPVVLALAGPVREAQAASTKYLVSVNNNVGPGLGGSISATVQGGGPGELWVGTIPYHAYRGFESRYPTTYVRAQWKSQVVWGYFTPACRGRVLEVIVQYNRYTGRIYLQAVQR